MVANGLYWRERRQVEMWTAPNDCIERPQIWDLLSHHGRGLSSAVWFPLHSKGCEADYVCTPAPIHNPDGSESLWCYTRPTELYGTLRDRLGHFPLMNYWGPMADVKASRVDRRLGGDCRAGNGSPTSSTSTCRTSTTPRSGAGPTARPPIRPWPNWTKSSASWPRAWPMPTTRNCSGSWPASTPSRRSITSVYPNRVLREAGLLAVREADDGEQSRSRAEPGLCAGRSSVLPRLRGRRRCSNWPPRWPSFSAASRASPKCWSGSERGRYDLDHPRSGEVILISTPRSWQAYYWWLSDDRAPRFARTVDIHRKPGYDPVELFFDPATEEHPAGRRADQGLARRPGRRPLATERAAGVRADVVSRPDASATPTCSASCCGTSACRLRRCAADPA